MVRGRGSHQDPAPAEVVRLGRRFWDATAAWRARVGDDPAPGGSGSLAGVAESAIQDLWVLTDQLPAPVAAWTPHWRYVWPRDAAFCAVALARSGHAETALDVLEHLQPPQHPDGGLEARHGPGTPQRPHDRPPRARGEA